MSCLRGDLDVDAPRPLYPHDDDEEITNGINMIGKARLVSASPFRASVKVDRDAVDDAEQKNQNSDDDEFEREELPELNKIKESPIKDDSELLRNQRNDILTNLSQSQLLQKQDGSPTNRSERTP